MSFVLVTAFYPQSNHYYGFWLVLPVTVPYNNKHMCVPFCEWFLYLNISESYLLCVYGVLILIAV